MFGGNSFGGGYFAQIWSGLQRARRAAILRLADRRLLAIITEEFPSFHVAAGDRAGLTVLCHDRVYGLLAYDRPAVLVISSDR